jgi:2-dehydro-3-deoxyphosphooctonate aldolase (KDO 8-P synthase)
LTPLREIEVGVLGDGRVRRAVFGHGHRLAWIAGPCVIESRDIMARTAETLRKLADEHGVGLVFKSSFEKDNRSSEKNYPGPGIQEGLEVLAWIRREFELPVLSDVHRVEDLAAASEVLDVIQIPAFLCQQTSLLVAAAKCGKVVNIKKGQFLSPDAMSGPIGKVARSGCQHVLVTERGTCFGYNQLVADMTAIPVMQSHGCPVVFDAGHQVRRYGIPSADPRGGARQFIPVLVRAGVAAGANGVFLETHPDPQNALCDAASQYPLERMGALMREITALADLLREQGHA